MAAILARQARYGRNSGAATAYMAAILARQARYGRNSGAAGTLWPQFGRGGLRHTRGSGFGKGLGGLGRTSGYGRARIIPPSTGTIAPVTNDAAGDSRNAPTRPSSTGSP